MAKYDLTTIPPRKKGYFDYLSGHYGSPLSMGYAYDNGAPSREATGRLVLDLFTGFKDDATIRNNLYNNLKPRNYANSNWDVFWRTINSINNKTHEGYDELRDDIWATYLGIPAQQRHYKDKKDYTKVIPSKYKPAKAKDKDAKYYALSNLGDFLNYAVDYGSQNLDYNQSEVSHHLGQWLGDHTISKGRDDKGTYISYYDLWDIAPFSQQQGKFATDQSSGIGTPVEFYDRVYLDDYYGIPRDPKSTYIPEVQIFPYYDEDGDPDFNRMWKAARGRNKKQK